MYNIPDEHIKETNLPASRLSQIHLITFAPYTVHPSSSTRLGASFFNATAVAHTQGSIIYAESVYTAYETQRKQNVLNFYLG